MGKFLPISFSFCQQMLVARASDISCHDLDSFYMLDNISKGRLLGSCFKYLFLYQMFCVCGFQAQKRHLETVYLQSEALEGLASWLRETRNRSPVWGQRALGCGGTRLSLCLSP